METLHFTRINSPVGHLVIGVSEKGLTILEFDRGHLSPKFSWVESRERAARYVRQLEEYFAGKRQNFDFPLDLRGTEFQLRCWNALLKIPYGETRTYGEQARVIGCPRGFRAVGAANHDNPIAIVVPCHRVIAAGGGLHGYGGGLENKRWLLELEGAMTPALAS